MIAITIDVDGEAGLACRPVPGGWDDRLTARSEARYGLVRGLPRILAVLAEFRVHATFYVPGTVAEEEPDAIAAIAGGGHEIGHHGHAHLPSHALDAAGQRRELEDGLAALAAAGVARPLGYRSPAWELTPVTLALLGELGFAYDSSLMGDDRPYRLEGGLVELPVHWSLDDVPAFAYGPGIPHSPPAPVAAVAATWLDEHDLACAEGRHLTYTVHPDVTGRGSRIALLRTLLGHATEHGTGVVTHAELARAAR